MRRQDVIEVLDGQGGIYQARIVDDDARACEIKIVSSKRYSKPGYQITLAVSPTKNLDRMEWMVEKTAELGIDRIIPITCQHSERRFLKTDRLKKKALGALKQSRNPFLSQIDELTSFEDLIDDDWSAEDIIDTDVASDTIMDVPPSWQAGAQSQGSYISPFSYDGIEDDGWSTDLASEARNLMPSEDDSPFLQSIKVLSAVLLTAGGLFLVLKVPTAQDSVPMQAEQSRWLEALEM